MTKQLELALMIYAQRIGPAMARNFGEKFTIKLQENVCEQVMAESLDWARMGLASDAFAADVKVAIDENASRPTLQK